MVIKKEKSALETVIRRKCTRNSNKCQDARSDSLRGLLDIACEDLATCLDGRKREDALAGRAAIGEGLRVAVQSLLISLSRACRPPKSFEGVEGWIAVQVSYVSQCSSPGYSLSHSLSSRDIVTRPVKT